MTTGQSSHQQTGVGATGPGRPFLCDAGNKRLFLCVQDAGLHVCTPQEHPNCTLAPNYPTPSRPESKYTTVSGLLKRPSHNVMCPAHRPHCNLPLQPTSHPDESKIATQTA